MTTTNDHRNVKIGRMPIRIESTGCVVYIERTEEGTRVDVVCDGDRFAGQRATCALEYHGVERGSTTRVHVAHALDKQPT